MALEPEALEPMALEPEDLEPMPVEAEQLEPMPVEPDPLQPTPIEPEPPVTSGDHGSPEPIHLPDIDPASLQDLEADMDEPIRIGSSISASRSCNDAGSISGRWIGSGEP